MKLFKRNWNGKELQIKIEEFDGEFIGSCNFELDGMSFHAQAFSYSESIEKAIDQVFEALEQKICWCASGSGVTIFQRLLDQEKQKELTAQWLVKQFNIK